MSSSISHQIKNRVLASDIFYTPEEVAKKHINLCNELWIKMPSSQECVWLDPCCGKGVYLNNFPKYHQYQSLCFGKNRHIGLEIQTTPELDKEFDPYFYPVSFLHQKEYFTEEHGFTPQRPLLICSNPPYSMIDTWLKQSVALEPKLVSYLLAVHALTPKRLQFMEDEGFYLHDLTLLKIKPWYGMSALATWILKDDRVQKPSGSTAVNFDRGSYGKNAPSRKGPLKSEIIAELTKLGLSTKGLKKELIIRLKDAKLDNL